MDVIVADCLRQKPDGLHFLSCFQFGNGSSCAFARAVRLGFCVRANSIYVGVTATWYAEESYVRFSSACRAGPCIYSRLPFSLNSWDAFSTCCEKTISCTNIVMTYKIPATGRATQQMATLSITNSSTCSTICTDMWASCGLVISRNNRSKTFTRLRQANMICPGPSEICPAPLLSF